MPDFELPSQPADLPLRIWNTYVGLFQDLTVEEFDALADKVGEVGESRHASFAEPAAIGGEVGELRGLIGIHDRRNSKLFAKYAEERQKDKPNYTGLWLHYDLTFRHTSSPRDPFVDDDWQKLCDALHESLREHTVEANVRVLLSDPGTVLVMTLPVKLGPSATGFTEIRGMRLVQVDEKDPEQELYSVFVDCIGEETTIEASTVVHGRFDNDIMVKGFDAALEVVRLTIREVGEK